MEMAEAQAHGRRARWRSGRPKLLRSLRWRLVWLFLLMALATTVIFLGGMQQVLRGGWQAYARPLIGDYLDRLALDIGSPPDLARAQALAARLPLTIHIDGPTLQWDSRPASARHERYGGWRDDEHSEDRDWWQSRTLGDGSRVSFGLAHPPTRFVARTTGWLTLGLLLGVTVLAYAYVQRLLRPLADIRRGARRFGRGEFAEPILVRRQDELGELAGQINTMAAELHRMLDAKRALLLAISHELRSPLTRARVNAELVDESQPQRALLRDLAQMRDLVSDLLESERLATGHAALQTETTDLNTLLREVIESQFALREVTVTPASEPATLPLDRVRMRLLLRNLIDNALRHSGAAQRPPTARITRSDDGLRLSVRDFGPGVPQEHLPHLAEPFYRADSARQRATGGVGLGLHLCRLVAEAHGGTLAIRNAQPGLEVTVHLPTRA